MISLEGFASRAQQLRVLDVMVSQGGETLARKTWDDPCRRNVYSVSKSFTSCAVGFAIQEGLLSLSERLTDAFPDELPPQVSDNLSRATVRDLLTMCLGQQQAFLMGEQRPAMTEHDWVRYSLALPFVDVPGTRFVYNNVGPYLAGILVQRRAGCDLVSYLMPRLFEPLGIWRPTWETDPMGFTFGAGGLMLSLPEMHRLGLLYEQKGRWQGRQLLDEGWIEESTCAQVPNGQEGYGYLFWRGEKNSYRADGKYAQFSIVIPDKHAVISTQSECRDAGGLLRAIFDEIYPQL